MGSNSGLWRSTFAFIFATLPLQTTAKCNNFTVINHNSSSDQLYTATKDSQRVSALVNCSGSALGSQFPTIPSGAYSGFHQCNSSQCALYTPEYFRIEVNSALNVSIPTGQLQDLFTLVANSVDLPSTILADFNATTFHRVTNAYGTCLNNGTAGWINFTPTFLCVDGILSSCSGDDGSPVDGTSMQACGLRLLNTDNGGMYYGSFNIVNSYGEVSSPAPANNSLPNSLNTSETTTGSNGSVARGGNDLALMTRTFVTVVFALILSCS